MAIEASSADPEAPVAADDPLPTSRRRFLPESIGARFVLLLAVAFIPILLLLAWIYAERYQTQQARELQANLEIARAVGLAFDGFVDGVSRQELALGEALTTLSPFSTAQANQLLTRSAVAPPAVEAFLWVSPQGRVQASGDGRGMGGDIRHRPFFRRVGADETWVSDLYRAPENGTWQFAILRGIAGPGGSLGGLVVARIVPERLAETYVALRRPEGGGISLTDRQGRCAFRLAPPAPSRVGDLWSRDRATIRRALARRENTGIETVLAMRGQRWIAAATPIRHIGWVAGASRPEEAALIPIRADLLRDVSLFLLLDALALAAVLMISRGITAPVRRLQADAERLGCGDLAHRAAASGPAEVADLAVALNGMAARIQERTGALRESEEREHARAELLRAVMDAAPAGIILVAPPDARIAYANPRAGEIYAGRDLSALSIEERARYHRHPDGATYLPAEMPVWRALMNGESVHGEEMVVLAPEGSETVLEVHAAPVYSRDGGIEMAVVAFLDVTGRRRAERDLRQANEALKDADRRKDEFLAMLAHELRNPLAAISSAVQLMRTVGLEDPRLERARGAAERQTGHMARLLDDLLDVSRVTQGRVILKQEEVDLASVVESGVEATAPLIESRGHQLSVSLPDEALRVQGDPVRLTQIVTNLLINAAKYTPPSGHIWVEVKGSGLRARGSGPQTGTAPIPGPQTGPDSRAPEPQTPTAEPSDAEIRVRDNGQGITPELLPHLFDLFVQGERSPGRTEGGLGIGLTMVRKLVEMHGGSVEAYSEGPGKGSEFAVRIPLVGHPESRSLSPGPPPEPQATGARKRVLVVDDNADTAEMLAMALEVEGHEAVTALSGQAALDLAAGYRPDVVLLDLGMPGMDGYEVARHLRRDPELDGVLLVAVSGYGQDEDRERTREAGFDLHLVKPVDPEVLKKALASPGGARIE